MKKFLVCSKKWQLKNIVSILGISSTLYILLYKLLFLRYDELFKHASIIGELLFNLSFGILASTIFYFYVVHLKEQNNKNKLREVVNFHFEQIFAMKFMIFSDIKKASKNAGIMMPFPESIDSFKKVCQQIKLTDQPPPYYTGINFVQLNNWYDYFEYHFKEITYNIDMLFRFSDYLSSDSLKLMHDTMHPVFRKALRQYNLEKEFVPYAIEFDSLSHLLFHYLNLISKFERDSWL